MKKLWTVCILLAMVASAAFAGNSEKSVPAYKQEAVKEAVNLDKALLMYEAGMELSDAEKAAVVEYLNLDGVVDRGSSPLDGQGGPNAFGYRWVDNLGGDSATFAWIELDGDPLATNLTAINNSDDAARACTLSWAFPYYGGSFTFARPATNGQIALGTVSNTSFTNACAGPFTSQAPAIIFALWDDWHTGRGGLGGIAVSDSGSVRFRDFGTHAVFQWDSVGRSGANFINSASWEAILYPSGKIKLQYLNLDGTSVPSATIGIKDLNPAFDYLQYACNTGLEYSLDGVAVWFYVAAAAPGRCCYLDASGHGACADVLATECTVLGGTFTPGTSCAASPCPVGRCCYSGGCVDVQDRECTFLGGTFSATLSCATSVCPVLLQGSDLCADAPALTLGVQHNGTTVGSTPEVGLPACGDGYNASAPGIWYTILGTGNTMTATLCDLATFDTELFIFCGTCDALTCVEGNDDFCGLGSQQAWCSSLGTTYYILVTAFGTSTGPIAIRVTDDGIPCTTAVNCSPFGRCCYIDATGAPACADVIESECNLLGGEFNAALTCADGPCGGNCCYVIDNEGFCNDQAACIDNVLESACLALGGGWNAGLSCDGFACPSPAVPCVCACPTFANSHSTLAFDEFTYEIISFAPAACVIVNVPIEYQITDLNVCVDAIHTFDGDVDITITSPLGTTVILSDNRGGGGDNWVCTEYDDEALTPVASGIAPFTGSFIPDAALAAFDGENAVGNWVICFDDQVGGDEGYVIGVCLKFEYDEILPVAFGSFDAIAGNGSVTLNWNTNSETNVDRFELSRDGAVVANVDAQNSATGASYTYTDVELTNGTSYTYSLVAVDVNGARQALATMSATPSGSALITEYALHQNYPNPFNPTTNIAFDMVEAGQVTISIFNIMGQKVSEIVNGNMEAGRHVVTFDATSMSSGLYLYKMEANGFSAQSKMILMK